MVPPTTVVEISHAFDAFFQRWLMGQEHYLQELLRLIERNDNNTDEEHDVGTKNLINQVISHYVEYYEAKARVMREDVFLTLTPPWLTSFERAYLWIGGFRTGVAFRLVSNYVLDLTEDQSRRINALMTEIKEEEQGLNDELTRLQERMPSPAIMELTRHLGRPRDGEVAEMESAFERIRTSMEDLAQSADLLRRKTILGLMETLTPSQMVRFLAAMTQLQLRLHNLGMQREAQIQRRNANAQTDQN